MGCIARVLDGLTVAMMRKVDINNKGNMNMLMVVKLKP